VQACGPQEGEPRCDRPPRHLASVAIALFVACLTAVGSTLALWGSLGLWRSGSAVLPGIDFNVAPLEDSLGPHWADRQPA
ncbi:MAG: hypothetical protein ACI80K_004904, partial [Paracoccaceae bacterium]